MITGILPLDKPLGLTSHDVVARVRRIAGQRQVGHAGTLDPLATGLLLLVLGRATRFSADLMETDKVYCAEVVLGATTVTDDAEAPLAERSTSVPDRSQIESCLARFVGTFGQVPPAYSAVRQGGQKLYALARRGVEVDALPRQVTVTGIDILSWEAPRLRLRVCCGSGTYIRALARDLGTCLGTGAYLHALRRVASGTFTVDDAASLDDLTGPDDVAARVYPPDRAVVHLPALSLSTQEVTMVRQGRPLAVEAAAQTVRLYSPAGELTGLGRIADGAIHPFRVLDA